MRFPATSKNLVLSVIFVMVSMSMSAHQDDALDRFCSGLEGSCVEFSYSYSVRISGINNIGDGILTSQGPMWKLSGNGLLTCCDSVSLWVIDPSLKEVVIEPASADAESRLQTNPASLFLDLRENFEVSQSRTSDQGEAVLYILRPKRSSDISYVNVEFSIKDGSLDNAVVALNDGTLIKIEVSSVKLTPVRPVEDFRPQTVFDSSWIVTDLR